MLPLGLRRVNSAPSFLNHLSHQRRAFVRFGRGRESDYGKGDDESELIHDCLVLIGAGSALNRPGIPGGSII
jgi:hypothetical protein